MLKNLQHSSVELYDDSMTYRFRGSLASQGRIHDAVLLHGPRRRAPANVQAVWRWIVHLDVSCQPSHH